MRIAAHDRAGLERLLRYCARPPFALHRLRHATPERPLSSPDARVIYHLPRPARDGRSALRLAPLELLERLARLIPPPRVHRHRYHGVFAPNAAWRGDVVRYGRDKEQCEASPKPRAPGAGTPEKPCAHGHGPGRSRWARLLVAASGTVWEDLAGFSRAVREGDRILVSGTTATHRDRLIGGGSAGSQAHFCIDKIAGAVQSLGGSLDDIVRTRIYVADPGVAEEVSRVHGARFGHLRPANTLVQAGLIGDGYLVEMEAEAVVGGQGALLRVPVVVDAEP